MTLNLKRIAPPPKWGVSIDREALERTADRLLHQPFPAPGSGIATLPTDDPPERWCTFIGLSVSVLACLWPSEGEAEWRIDWGGQELTDAPALFGCFRRGLKLRQDRYDLKTFLDLDSAKAREFFAGKGHFQLIPERAERLRSIAQVLTKDWDGSFLSIVEQAHFDAEAVVELLIEHIPGYRDEAQTGLGLLRFSKLARLATAMMARRLPQPLKGLEDFPVYPDYMIPKVFRHWGIFVYELELAERIDRRGLVPKDSHWEYALRWGTIYAAELLRAGLEARGRPTSGPELDFFLWHSGVLGPEASSMGEHHRTITLAY